MATLTVRYNGEFAKPLIARRLNPYKTRLLVVNSILGKSGLPYSTYSVAFRREITLFFISIRVIHNARNEVRNEEGCGAINPCLVVLLAVAVIAEAQQPARVAKIGELVFGGRPGGGLGIGRELLRRELRQLGYIEGKNIVFEVRSAGGKPDRFPALADELVRLKVDVILATSGGEIRAAKNALGQSRRFYDHG